MHQMADEKFHHECNGANKLFAGAKTTAPHIVTFAEKGMGVVNGGSL